MSMTSDQRDASAQVLTLPRSSRAFLVGSTKSGKSTLAEVMVSQYKEEYSQERIPVRTLIVDTKPRFKAQYELNGLETKHTRRYSKWGYGSFIPNSIVMPLSVDPEDAIDQAWRLGSDTIIATAEKKTEWKLVNEYVVTFYERYGAHFPRLVYIDELADFFEIRILNDIYQRIARNGRERDCAMIACSQRPRKIPTEVMSEMTRLYLFNLDYWQDIKHIMEFGVPWEVRPPKGHNFYLYDRELREKYPSNAVFQLDMESKNWAPNLQTR